MPQYRRVKIYGGCVFFTVVTHQRRPILTEDICRDLLHQAWTDTARRFPFTTEAICLLPDHLHCIWQLPENDADYSIRWKEIKRIFTKEYLLRVGPGAERNNSHLKRGEAAIWQRRFWEHVIRDEDDLVRHVEYIHYNPVKHGLVARAMDWPWSSFHRYVKLGLCDQNWGWNQPAEATGIHAGE